MSHRAVNFLRHFFFSLSRGQKVKKVGSETFFLIYLCLDNGGSTCTWRLFKSNRWIDRRVSDAEDISFLFLLCIAVKSEMDESEGSAQTVGKSTW